MYARAIGFVFSFSCTCALASTPDIYTSDPAQLTRDQSKQLQEITRSIPDGSQDGKPVMRFKLAAVPAVKHAPGSYGGDSVIYLSNKEILKSKTLPLFPHNAADITPDQARAAGLMVRFTYVPSPPADPAQTHGCGCLVADGLVLTAKHVAQLLRNKPETIRVVLGSDASASYPVQGVDFIGNSDDPSVDLAIVKVPGLHFPKDVDPPSFRMAVRRNQKVFVVGTSRYSSRAILGTGMVTQDTQKRKVGGAFEREVFGTSTWSNLGVSGAPVFTSDGVLLGVQVDGDVSFVGGRESFIELTRDETTYSGTSTTGNVQYFMQDANGKEHPFESWTWVVPLSIYADQIDHVISNATGQH